MKFQNKSVASKIAGHTKVTEYTQLAGLEVRRTAIIALDRVLKGQAFEPLNEGAVAASRDRALANRLVTVALRRHGHLNHIIEALLSRGVPKRSGLFEAILRLSLTQLLFLPEMGAHSALHLAVEIARKDRRAGRFDKLLNGVLRQAQREEKRWQNLDMELLFPDWLAKKWCRQYGVETLERFGEALLEGAPLDITLKGENDDLIGALGAQRIVFDSFRVAKRDCPVVQMPGFEAGDWWVQDVAASLPAKLFDLDGGARVLDMCAAPGGKTAQLVKAGYQVTALDNSQARLKRLQGNLERVKYTVETVEEDARCFAPKQKYDGILIDAPCTALGTFRRHPEVLWHRLETDIKGRVALQRQIISNGVKCLKEGGILILCVCSLLEEEGETQGNWVIHNFPQLRPLNIKKAELGGLKGAITREGWVRTHAGVGFPGATAGALDGFFIARWQLESLS